jgi:hypothetical protein
MLVAPRRPSEGKAREEKGRKHAVRAVFLASRDAPAWLLESAVPPRKSPLRFGNRYAPLNEALGRFKATRFRSARSDRAMISGLPWTVSNHKSSFEPL